MKYLLISLLFLLSSCTKSPEHPAQPRKTASLLVETDKNGFSRDVGIIKTVHGEIKFKFYLQEAPLTSKRIASLIEEGFYTGQIFDKVIPNSFIQIGKSLSHLKIKDEINQITHKRGTLSLIRSEETQDSGDSKFFITLRDLPELDQKYTPFAKIISGIEVLDKVVEGDRILSIGIYRP